MTVCDYHAGTTHGQSSACPPTPHVLTIWAGLRIDKYHNLKDSLFPRPGLVLIKPQTTRDYMAMCQAAVLTWEILRYQRMKVGVLSAYQRPAMDSLLRKIKVGTASNKGMSAVMARLEAHQLAASWFKDPASRPAIMKMIETAG
jgi:hypothetical protein